MQTLFIATPTYDEWVCVEYATSLAKTCALAGQAGVGIYTAIAPGNPFLDLARNRLVDQFLKSDATDLLFVDADVGWDATMLGRILSHPQEVVGGLVPKRDPNNLALYHQNAITGVISPEGLFQCIEIPTAFLRIKRSAFERLQAIGVGTELLPFFKIGSQPKDFGEDIYFCRRWRETGEYLWIDPDISFTHRGGYVWRGNFFEHCVSSGAFKMEKAA